jgi:glycosyltransferase involved in cell wall biosynthesis
VNNPRSIAQKVEKLIKDKESRDYIIERARKMVEDKYQWNRIAGDMRDIFLG